MVTLINNEGDAGDKVNLDGDFAVTITNTPTEAQLATIDAATTGTISYGSDNDVTVTDQSVTASYLNTLDGDTTGTVNASAVTTITGTASEIKRSMIEKNEAKIPVITTSLAFFFP